MPESPHYALALVGVDRPGIVAAVTGALAEVGCNLEDVSTSLLRGHFAMVLEFSAPPDVDEPAMRRRLRDRAAALDLHLDVWPLTEHGPRGAATHVLTLHGPDRLGIVATIADTLARHRASIREMTCVREAGASPTYLVTMDVEVPFAAAGHLEEELRAAAGSLGLHLAFEPVEQAVL